MQSAEELWAEMVNGLRAGRRASFDEQWNLFQGTLADRRPEDGPPVVWRPDEAQIARTNLGQFMAELGLTSYDELHRFSVRERASFWGRVIERLGIVFTRVPESIIDLSKGVTQPVWLPGAEMNSADSCFTADPDEVAVISGSEGSREVENTTYGDLERLVNRVAGGLVEHGFGRGDGIALYMPMTLECVAAYLGIVRAGCTVISIADSFPPAELERRLAIGGARGLITVSSFTRAGKRIHLYDKVREAKAPHAVAIPQESADRVELRDGDVWWKDFLSSSDRFESASGDPARVTNVLFSSGTTATPKAIPWTHLTPIKCAMDGHFHQDIQRGDVIAWPTNIGWMMGPWLIYAALVNRASMALYKGIPGGEGFVRFVSDAGVTMLGVVPALVRSWMTLDAMEEIDWRRIRALSSTGEPSSQRDYLWLMSRTGYRAPVIEYCGGTEIGGGYITGTLVQPASPATFTTPALGLDFVILAEDGRPVAEGEMGEAYLLPPSIGLSQRLLNKDHDEIYYKGCPGGSRGEILRRHGDQLTRLPHGFYKAEGRSDDAMNLGGIKVSSLELERVLDSHDAVHESAAVARRPEDGGPEKLVVYAVVAGPEIDTAQLKGELGALIARELNPLFKIHDLVIVDSLPRTASNKLMRRQLRAAFKDRDSLST